MAALVLAGVGPFEALCHAFTTLATGGFSTRDLSVGALGSPVVERIITGFMLCAGINFVVHYKVLTGRFRAVARDGELRYFLIVTLLATAVVTATLVAGGERGADAVRLGAFQVVLLVSTTGYATADFEQWAPLAQPAPSPRGALGQVRRASRPRTGAGGD